MIVSIDETQSTVKHLSSHISLSYLLFACNT